MTEIRRVGVNTEFSRYPFSGMGQYLLGLIEGFFDEKSEFRLVPLDPPTVVTRFNSALTNNGTKARWELLQIARVAKQSNVDVLHCPYWASPLFPTCPTVVTIPDVIPLLRAKGFDRYRRSWKSKVYYGLVGLSARQATAVIALSEGAANDIREILHLEGSRVFVVPMAAAKRFQPASQSEIDRVRAKYGLNKPYMLTIASGFDFRKNLLGVIEAYIHLTEMNVELPQLVMASDTRNTRHHNHPNPMKYSIDKGLDEDSIKFPGYIEPEDMPALYSGSLLYISFSLYEGFGLTILEALSCGVPVVASDIPSLRELARDAALFVNPHNPHDLASAIKQLFENQADRRKLSELGLQRSQDFSWEKTAEKTAEVYRYALRQARRLPG